MVFVFCLQQGNSDEPVSGYVGADFMFDSDAGDADLGSSRGGNQMDLSSSKGGGGEFARVRASFVVLVSLFLSLGFGNNQGGQPNGQASAALVTMRLLRALVATEAINPHEAMVHLPVFGKVRKES